MGPAEPELGALIDAARRGDREFRDRLLSRYRNYLALLARISIDRALNAKLDASDIVQEVLVKADQGLPAFRGGTEEEFVAWLRRILTHTLADANRRFRWNEGRDVDRERSLEELVGQSSHALRSLPAANGTSPSRAAQRREVGARVADALAAMKPDDREVIVLRSLEEREWADVASRMGRSAEAVRALWGRAFQRLGALAEERRWSAP